MIEERPDPELELHDTVIYDGRRFMIVGVSHHRGETEEVEFLLHPILEDE